MKVSWLSQALSVAAIFLTAGLFSRPCFATTEAYYRFENGVAGSPATGTGTILDSSGNGLVGTPMNSPVYSSNVQLLRSQITFR